MPKGRQGRSVSCDRSSASPYPGSSSRTEKSSAENPLESAENAKDWEEARCPVCMEHPHNAILLLCSSHSKGCRPFMCDTSYRHSNCFDLFRKSFGEASTTALPLEEEPTMLILHAQPGSVISSDTSFTDLHVERSEEASATMQAVSLEEQLEPNPLCPLCRGETSGWVIVHSARRLMNAKSRSCPCETCNFSGNYTDLRKHARQMHPLVRPTEANPEIQRNWRRMEQERDMRDLLRILQSSYPQEERSEGNTSLSEGNSSPNEGNSSPSEGNSSRVSNGRWLATSFIFRIFQYEDSSSSRSSGPGARAAVTLRRRCSRRYWEDREADSSNNDNGASDGGSG